MFDKFLRFTWPNALLLVAAWVLCVILHNLLYVVFNDYFAPHGDEPFFFLLAVVVIPLYTAASIIYTIATSLTRQFANRNPHTL